MNHKHPTLLLWTAYVKWKKERFNFEWNALVRAHVRRTRVYDSIVAFALFHLPIWCTHMIQNFDRRRRHTCTNRARIKSISMAKQQQQSESRRALLLSHTKFIGSSIWFVMLGMFCCDWYWFSTDFHLLSFWFRSRPLFFLFLRDTK